MDIFIGAAIMLTGVVMGYVMAMASRGEQKTSDKDKN